MRVLRVLTTGLLFVGVFLPLIWAQSPGSNIERALFEAANKERRDQRLPALKWNDALAGAARRHAEEMAQQHTLSHQLPGEPSLAARVAHAGLQHSWLSENIAEGTSASDIHDQFMKSTNHRANILDPDMDTAGIGVSKSGGKWYAVEDFCKAK